MIGYSIICVRLNLISVCIMKLILDVSFYVLGPSVSIGYGREIQWSRSSTGGAIYWRNAFNGCSRTLVGPRDIGCYPTIEIQSSAIALLP